MPSALTREQVEAYLRDPLHYWVLTDEDCVTPWRLSLTEDKVTGPRVPFSLLADIDPRLPGLFAVLFSAAHSGGSCSVASAWVTTTLDLWATCTIVRDWDGNVYACQTPYDIDVFLRKGEVDLYVACKALKEMRVPGQTQTVFVPKNLDDFHRRGLGLEIVEMERAYPGWKTRWEIARELGLSDKERAAYVCQKPAVQATLTLPMDVVVPDGPI